MIKMFSFSILTSLAFLTSPLYQNMSFWIIIHIQSCSHPARPKKKNSHEKQQQQQKKKKKKKKKERKREKKKQRTYKNNNNKKKTILSVENVNNPKGGPHVNSLFQAVV